MLNRPTAFFHGLLAVICGLSLAACSFRPAPPDGQAQSAKLDAFIAEGGYSAARQFQIDGIDETWRHDGQAIGISLLAPAVAGSYPLIVYLPGLGEPAESGRLWREHWAKAGYMVFSVQPEAEAKAFAELKPPMPDNIPESSLPDMAEDREFEDPTDTPEEDDENGRRRHSRLARSGELRYIGHEFFGPQSLATRIRHVLWAYAQCQQRIKAKQGLFAGGDASQMLIAGYDLGAQTAAALLGEETAAPLPAISDFKPLAALIISPSVDAASGKLLERYRKITLPLLTATSEEDNDPYAITAPKLRTAIWDHAASSDNYLLLLKHAGHGLLSGSAWLPSPDNLGRQGFMPDVAGRFRRGRQNGGPQGRMAMAGGPFLRGEEAEAPIHQQVAAIASVSTAFFDSIVKSDNFAALWLTQKAQAWLKSTASLTRK